MHGWPAVADLTSGRPIGITLFQVGAAPKAPAHFKLSQHISQRSDPFLCSLKLWKASAPLPDRLEALANRHVEVADSLIGRVLGGKYQCRLGSARVPHLVPRHPTRSADGCPAC